MQKDRTILEVWEALRHRFEGQDLALIDRWADDPYSIGVARADQPNRLVFISNDRLPDGEYFASLELPPEPGSEFPYQQGEEYDDLDVDALAAIVAEHLGLRVV